MITLTKNGVEKKVSTGYSFKSLFFALLYPLVRGDFKGAIIQFLLTSFTCGVSWLIVPFFYNKVYIKRLLIDDWKPSGHNDRLYLLKRRLITY